MTRPPGPQPPRPVPRDPGSALWQLVKAQAGGRPGDATALLRGAAHTDRAFRDKVIAELAEHPYRVPPPSYGVDLVAVLKECLFARRRAARRGALMLVLPLPLLAVDAAGALMPLLLVLITRFWLFVARVVTGALERGAARTGSERAVRGGRVLTGVLWLLVVVFLASRVLGGLGGLVADGTGRHLLTALLVLAGWTVVAAVDLYRRTCLLHLLATGRAPARPDGHGRTAARFRQLARQQADPDVIYSDYAPFVGAGIEMDSWSFAIELLPDTDRADRPSPGERLEKRPPEPPAELTVPAVHARIRAELLRLGEAGRYPGDRLHGIHVDDYVMKSGRRLGPAADWSGTGPGTAFHRMAPFARRAAAVELGLAPGAPVPATWWPDSLDVAAEERLRHYLAARVGSWEDEVVLTVFSRVQLQGGLLFLESRAFLLPPIARTYHALDDVMPPADLADWAALVRQALGSAVVLAGEAPRDLVRGPRTSALTTRNEDWYTRMCRTDRVVDHGPRYSVRELAAEPHYQQLFQEMDVARFLTGISTRTVTAVRGCLRDAGYRTSEYDSRANVVFDNSVHVNGTVHGNVQTGDRARASYRTVTPPRPHMGPGSGPSSPGS
ncbi:hypothetical protein AF335_20360 [Streptomyces eurocidicus]|uniref:Uncharacterized protein n=1 Tax=Streptomyces eurocidicus TaxID=66423 RepID=A0A2N8NTJ3_STREU|nr:hypothetical protein [Streptomyces eurocidicus]MBB5122928.1 hypothetical protein [Streptomyces eurocidicus]MBF6056509.1 hypothetical protein [Streptomyces eurocidicus]PNE32098.1 hypothetical protein AF335_20360 [Streptomyces eurocidicus]